MKIKVEKPLYCDDTYECKDDMYVLKMKVDEIGNLIITREHNYGVSWSVEAIYSSGTWLIAKTLER